MTAAHTRPGSLPPSIRACERPIWGNPLSAYAVMLHLIGCVYSMTCSYIRGIDPAESAKIAKPGRKSA